MIATGTPRGKNAVEGTDGTKSPVELELEQMKVKLDEIGTGKDELLRQKAEYDSRKVYARDLLNLIDAMKNTAPVNIESTEQVTSSSDTGKVATYQDEIERQFKDYPASCTDVNDFFERTAYARHHGPITEFSGDDCDEFIEQIIVHTDHMTVVFKAGISVEVKG